MPKPLWPNTRRAKSESRQGLACPPEEDMARQEFKKDADINVIVERIMRGQPVPMTRNAGYSATDYTADLDSQYQTLQQLRQEHHAFLEKYQLELPFLEYLEKLATGEELVPPDPEPTTEPANSAGTEQTPQASA